MSDKVIPAAWLWKLPRFTWHGVMAYPLAEEQWIRADAIDALAEEAIESSLAEREQRIAELEAALRHEIANCVNCEGLGQFKCGKCADDVLHDCKRCARARATLATEGEKSE